MQKAILGLIPILLLALYSCQSSDPKTTNPNPTNTTEPATKDIPTPPDPRPPLYLEGAYATSNDLAYPLQNLFDQDPESYWRTSSGAGLDEGIMLYFLGPVGPYIEMIKIPASKLQAGAILNWEVYVNGQPIGHTSGEPLAVESNVKSMFFRIIQVEGTQLEEYDQQGETIQVRNYPADGVTQAHTLQIFQEGGREVHLVPPASLNAQIRVSSTLAPEEAYHYSNLFDARKEFAWVEGAEGNGPGQRISFLFDDPQPLTHLAVWNGYQRSPVHFAANARLKKMSIQVNDQMPADFTIADDTRPQVIRLPESNTLNQLQLEITEVYPGGSYKDLVISELLFMQGDVPYRITSNWPEQRAKERIKELKGSPLANWLGKNIFNAQVIEEEIGLTSQRSLILRADGTFVYYNTEEDMDDQLEQVADGNWQILAASPEKTDIKLFGRFVDFTQLDLLYSGNSTDEFSRIFKEEISITAHQVNGKKFISDFYLP